jgi:hypothetical protein
MLRLADEIVEDRCVLIFSCLGAEKAHGASRRQRHRPLILDRTARKVPRWHR